MHDLYAKVLRLSFESMGDLLREMFKAKALDDLSPPYTANLFSCTIVMAHQQ